ncbi:peptidoglycan D,D-transpeptidase FtsI family protein [Bifidobacterium avesanii]|uniref:Penicillin-binding protein 2 n=1 Tax=Bifidobacterium avesanii TaxID=1798157 RepID=A0A7K3TIN0_9BIFI|nr:penicillin-binding transpeptidase domain-containing protein [Bifidobacterium avesanii]KAB8290121.1 penicillin-binding protein [Bifidobacterium avesanii]NEG78931.1 penicillin-binding protein 2 [Bifidobacterium avesanii]
MNKSLRQLFTAVITLFVVLGLSSTVIMAFRADTLNADARNRRGLYAEYGTPRGSILASDGTVIAQSDPVSDSFKYQRVYADGATYAAVTGYYSITSRSDRGLEASRNSLLSGQSDSLWLDRIKSLFTGSETKGASIETSISPALQKAAMEALGDNEGAVVAIEPSTGRILAMASTPSYDPNPLAAHDGTSAISAYQTAVNAQGNPMLNRTISEHYPPGSTFKVIVAAAALESGQYQSDTMIPAGSSYTLPGTVTNLTNTTSQAAGSNGQISLKDALTWSSNTAFAQLGVKLGNATIGEQAEKLGFDKPITVDDSGSGDTAITATASQFPNTSSDDKLALASIGQGDTVITPLQNALVAAAVANGGKLMKPTLVDRVRGADLSVISETKPTVMSQAFSQNTANALKDMMSSVVSQDAPSLQLSQGVAAKTGTAQIGNGDRIDGWTIGFAPADNPKIAVAVVIHNVRGFGVSTAGPVMKRVMQEALK